MSSQAHTRTVKSFKGFGRFHPPIKKHASVPKCKLPNFLKNSSSTIYLPPPPILLISYVCIHDASVFVNLLLANYLKNTRIDIAALRLIFVNVFLSEIPSLEAYFADAIGDMDPDQCVEEMYW